MKLRELTFTKLQVFVYLILYFPFILLIANIFYARDLVYGEYFVKSLAVSVLLFMPILFIRKEHKVYLWVIVPLLAVSSVINLVHMAIYKSEVSQNGIYALLETNSSEAAEFVSNYMTFDILIFIICLTVIPFFVLYHVRITESSVKTRNRILSVMILCVIANCLYAYEMNKVQATLYYHPLSGIFMALDSYAAERANLREAYKKNVCDNIEVHSADRTFQRPDILVVVVGESLTSNHMGLYGYDRNTTPKLSAMKNDLIVFKKPYTKYYATIPSLTRVFSYEDGHKNLPLIDILNKAGANTAWISNQAALGEWETMLTVIVKDARFNQYMNNSTGGLQQTQLSIYDSNMEKPLKELLNRKGRQIIFLHLMGSHSTYSSRYPDSFSHFTGEEGIPRRPWLKSKRKYDKINTYDNSVLYNDTIVTDFINELKKSGKSSLMMYFSDHGENVYEDSDFAGHTDAHGTLSTARIPLIFWLSDSYKKSNPSMAAYLNKRAETRYNIAGLKDMILKISGITFRLK